MRRTRVIIGMCLVGATIFTTLDLSAWRPEILPTVLFKLFGISLAILAFVLIGRPWAVRRAWVLAILTISIAYLFTVADRILNHGGEYQTTALLVVGAALTTGAIMPWGVIAQLVTVTVAATLLGLAVLLHDGTLAAVGRDPSAAVGMAFLLSVVAANEVNRYRVELRRELLDRRRAEATVRRLASRLESRVAERTVALEQAHQALRQHQAELAHALRLHTAGEMTAALAHEINQPLGAITNYAQGGVQRLRTGPVDPAALREAFEEIAREGLRAGQIIRGLRNLVQRETAVSDGVDVNALAAEAVRLLEPQARVHGVTVRLESASHPASGAGRRHPDRAGDAQPDAERHGGRGVRRGRAPRGRRRHHGAGGRDRGHRERHRQRLRAGCRAPPLHAVLHHQVARARPRARDQPLDRRVPRRPAVGDVRSRRGRHLPVLAAARRRATAPPIADEAVLSGSPPAEPGLAVRLRPAPSASPGPRPTPASPSPR